MKPGVRSVLVALVGVLMLSGCVAAIGNRDSKRGSGTTVGQELIDLQKAKDAGVINDAEYQTQRARLLDSH